MPPKKYIFANMKKRRYNFDSSTLNAIIVFSLILLLIFYVTF